MMVVRSQARRSSNMKLEDMQLFILVVETGSFTKAADYCHMPKSTISRRISHLERDLDTRLLQRTTRSLNMTEAGELFYQRALSILEQVEETEKELSEDQDEVKGKLVIYIPTLILAKCRKHVSSFAIAHPNCELELHSTAMGQRAVLDKRFDLMMYIGEPFDSSFIARHLADMGYDYFASPRYLEKHGIPEVPGDLFAHRCIYRMTNESDPISWRFGGQELAIKPGIICDSPYVANALTLQGTGISQLPLILAGDLVATGNLVQLFEGEYAFRRNIYGIYSSRHYLPHKVKMLIKDIREDLPAEIRELEASMKKRGTVDKESLPSSGV